VSRIAIVGSGMMGSNVALDLVQRGHEVHVFEKGPEYPYPHAQPYDERVRHLWENPRWTIARDLRHYEMTGEYRRNLTDEAVMVVGGAGTRWTGLTMRMREVDFRTRTAFGYGRDWPIQYADLEPWYCAAEERMGVSGTDDDNPSAPPRSKPYPLPPFELTWDDRLLASRLERAGLHVHTTPQARTRLPFADRPGCMNFNGCDVCPIGARYSPSHHLMQALATGRCHLHAGVSVRRIVTDTRGRARALLVRDNDGTRDVEHPADLIVVAAGALEGARLLLLSTDARHTDGLGNNSGLVGRGLVFHHIWAGHMHYPESLFAGRLGPWTGQIEQFCNPEGRGRIGGVKVELPSSPSPAHVNAAADAHTIEAAREEMKRMRHCRRVAIHAESTPDARKYVRLGRTQDRFGDPRLEIHYDLNDFDRRTYDFGRELFQRVARGSGATDWEYREIEDFGIFNHYSGTCAMSAKPEDGVVDPFGRVHDTPGLWVLGLGTFVDAGGALNPTLTGLALSLRAIEPMQASLAG
jgi:choline dehydrogenase-like flavoprotein